MIEEAPDPGSAETTKTIVSLEATAITEAVVPKRLPNRSLTCTPRLLTLTILMLGAAASSLAEGGDTLMRFPTLHGDNVVFEAHGNLWRVNRSGGVAERLTSEPGYELMPRYSPDGRWIAFTGQYQGNVTCM